MITDRMVTNKMVADAGSSRQGHERGEGGGGKMRMCYKSL